MKQPLVYTHTSVFILLSGGILCKMLLALDSQRCYRSKFQFSCEAAILSHQVCKKFLQNTLYSFHSYDTGTLSHMSLVLALNTPWKRLVTP